MNFFIQASAHTADAVDGNCQVVKPGLDVRTQLTLLFAENFVVAGRLLMKEERFQHSMQTSLVILLLDAQVNLGWIVW